MTLDLLEDTPLACLTTRQIAKQLGLSQPALFRHFRTREAILLSVMRKAQTDLGAIADAVLKSASEPKERLTSLATSLLAHVEEHPGLARLLFSPPEKGPLRDLLRQLVSMQRALISQLVKDGQELSVFRSDIYSGDAALYFMGMIQGIVLRSQLEDIVASLREQAQPMLRLWLDGMRPSHESPQVTTEATVANRVLVSLDVRPILSGGTDPLEDILAALAIVLPGGVLSLIAPFRPTPLLRLLGEQGHLVVDRETGEDSWSIDIVVGGAPCIDELLDLEPPEPLERALEATATLAPGERYIARLPRFPKLLLPHLAQRSLAFETTEAPDGTTLLHVTA